MTKVHPVIVIEIDPTKRSVEVLDDSLRDIRHNDAMSTGHVLQLGDAQVDESKLAELCKQYGFWNFRFLVRRCAMRCGRRVMLI